MQTKPDMLGLLQQAPIIAAIKDEQGLEACLDSRARVVFVLYGSVTDIPAIAGRLSAAGKLALLHLDLVDGLAPREAAVEYIAASTPAHGIITTKGNLIPYAMAKGLVAVRRCFVLDSLALANVKRHMQPGASDFIEVLPGVMPKVLSRLAGQSPVPLIAGGLLSDKEDVIQALSAGAVAISTTRPELWSL